MRRLIFLIFLFSTIITLAQKENRKFNLYGESAYILPQYSLKYSLFEEAEFGIKKNLSIKAHPIMLFLSPSISLKYNFYNKNNLAVSSSHGINYPTLLMNLVKAEGTGGFISPEFEIPNMFSIRNSILATYSLNDSSFLTGGIGFEFALNNSDLDPGTSIDLPFILPRSMVYYKNFGIDLSTSIEGILYKDFNFYAKSEIFFFPFDDDNYDYEYQESSNSFFWEFSGNIFWNIRQSFKMGIGAKLCYGTYPFGTQWHLLPFLDFVKYIDWF